MNSESNKDQDSNEPTKTEEHIQVALNWVIAGVDDDYLYNIMLGRGLTPNKARTIIRWATAKAKDLGWI